MAPTLQTAGKQWIVDKMRGSVVTEQKYVQWGTSSTAESAAQTALQSAANEARVSGTMSSPSAAKYRVVATVVSSGTQTIREAGLFDAAGTGTPATGGVMLIRGVHSDVPVVAADEIEYTFDLTIS